MKILFVAQTILRRELGGPKVVIELCEAINKIGHEATVVGPEEINLYLQNHHVPTSNNYASNIKKYLLLISNNYDVIDVDANHLFEYLSVEKEPIPLIVARSVLFIPHLKKIKWPTRKTLKNYIGATLRNFLHGNLQKKEIEKFNKSIHNADLINVSNDKDVEILLTEGHSNEKIICLPYGIFDYKRKELNKLANISKKGNNIVFIGTFDFRKGCIDIPKIFEEIKRQIPDAQLTLLGAKGLFQKKKNMYSFFPKRLRKSVTIIPEYKESELPKLLENFKIGIFPSYLEGFGFSVIELMASGIPVVAYNAPGPSSILPPKYMVPSGDWKALSDKAIYLLSTKSTIENAQIELLKKSSDFDWNIIGHNTLALYKKHLLNKLNTVKKKNESERI